MSINAIIAFNSAVQQMKQNQMDSINIDAARANLDQKQQELDITRQTKESQIHIANNQGAISDYQTKAMMDYLKNQFKPHQDLIDATGDAQDLAQHKLDQQNQKLGIVAKTLTQDLDVQGHVGNMLKGMNASNGNGQTPISTQQAPSAGSISTPNLMAGEQSQIQKTQQGGVLPSIFPTTSQANPINDKQTLGLFGSPSSPVTGSAQGMDAQAREGSAQPQQQGQNIAPEQTQPQQQEQAPPPLGQALGHLDPTPFGANPQKDYYMNNPNMMEAMKDGKYLIQKPPEIINQENPLRLSERQKFVEDHAKDLMKSGYSRDDIMSQLPSDLSETVDGIGRYKQGEQVLLGGMQATPQVRSAYIGLVRKLFPNYDVNKFGQVAEYRKQLGEDSGNSLGSRVVSVNTVADHLAQMSQLADQLKSQNVPVQNGIINFVRTNLGHPEVTNFNDAKEIVSNEIENILSQKGATQSGVKRMEGNLNANMSPDQLKGFVQVNAPLIADRVQALRSQYKSNIGAEDNGEILYPETRQRFSELMGGRDVFSEFDKGKNPFSAANKMSPQSSGQGNTNDAFSQKALAAGYSQDQINQYLAGKK